ncbi:MAG: hypothetical protein BGO76_01065 [Caedibacter sp. 38-128]|nr:DUF72 domain-containing protein [Holosporales bacterium]OJX05730.1 MAG: hypothetical protein BGO76_01065 [Caedibacter sp. 38-128]
MTNHIYIGCSGWAYREWIGKFYPLGLKSQDHLNFYVNHFNTVEVNSTFYQYPSTKTALKWYHAAPLEFKYTLKAHQMITHKLKFNEAQEWIKQTYALCDLLQEKMGCFLFQLPPSFIFTERNLENILFQLNPIYKNVLEFRHPSWWKLEVFKACKLANITICSVSGMNVPEIIIPDQHDLYVRFHGNPTYEAYYKKEALEEWGKKIKTSQPENIWLYFNNTRLGHAPYNALKLRNILS